MNRNPMLDEFCRQVNGGLDSLEQQRVSLLVKGLTDLVLSSNPALFEAFFEQALKIQHLIVFRTTGLVAHKGRKPVVPLQSPANIAEDYRAYLRRKYVLRHDHVPSVPR